MDSLKLEKTQHRAIMDDVKTSDAIHRISDLPDFVLHHILSFLERDSAARTSVLSKRWSSVWNTFPIIQFRLNLPKTDGVDAKTDAYINAVDEAFHRLARRNLRVEKLLLTINNTSRSNNHDSRINQWLALALCNGAQEVFFSAYMTSFHRVPETMFAARPVQGGFCPRFGSLVKLVLHSVCVSDSIIRNIVLNCPHIEYFQLLYFTGLKSLEISKLGKLKKVSVSSVYGNFERVDIDSPSLKEFNYWSCWKLALRSLNLASCRSIKSLGLGACTITDEWLRSQLPRLPLLENVKIEGCPALQRVRVSALRLRRLHLLRCRKIELVEIDAPILSSFEFEALSYPVLLSENVLCPMNVSFSCSLLDTEFDTSWFLKLRSNLGVSTDQRKILTLRLLDFGLFRVSFDQRKLKDIVDEVPPKVNVDYLKLRYCITREGVVDWCDSLIDGLLWSCHPNTISLYCAESLYHMNCTKNLCTNLLEGVQNPTCCSAYRVKCWRHDLKAIKLESFKGIGDDKEVEIIIKDDARLLCWNTLLDIVSPYCSLELRFRLEWHV